MSRDDYKVDVPVGTSGQIRVEKFTVPEQSVENIRLMFQGRGVIPGEYTRLVEGGRLWMSDTSAEWRDHAEAVWNINRMGGRVLIHGLGLGMVVKAALACEKVEHVDVVEINQDVINLVGPTYSGGRCTIHHADAYTKTWPVGSRWTVAWHDIWPEVSEDDLAGMSKLKRMFGRRVSWQGCWGEALIRNSRYG